MGSVGGSRRENEIRHWMDAYDKVFQFYHVNNDNYFKRTQILMFALQIGVATAFIKLLGNIPNKYYDWESSLQPSIYITFTTLAIVSILGIVFAWIWLKMIQRQRNVLQYGRMYLRFIEDQLMNFGVPLSIFRAESRIFYFGKRVFFCNRLEMRDEIKMEARCNDYSSPKAFPDRYEKLKVGLMGLEKWIVHIIIFLWAICISAMLFLVTNFEIFFYFLFVFVICQIVKLIEENGENEKGEQCPISFWDLKDNFDGKQIQYKGNKWWLR